MLSATTDSVGELGRYVVDLATAAGLDDRRAYRLRLATEEIATNLVVHGFREGPQRPSEPTFAVESGTSPDTVWIRLIDRARPFDPTSVATPSDLDAPLEERHMGGLGIHLVRTSLDEFTYERRDDTNRVTLGVRRRTEEGGPDAAEGRTGGG